MLDLIEEGAFVATGSGCLQPVSKAAVFREFMVPLDLEEEIAARDAEAALAFLVEQGMVEVADDTVTVPARFGEGNRIWNLLDKPVRRLPGSGRIDSTTLWLVTTRGRRWTVSQPALRAWMIRGRATPVGTICWRC